MSVPTCANTVVCPCEPIFDNSLPTEPVNIEAALSGLLWLLPCQPPAAPGDPGCNCSDPTDQSSVITGEPGKLYTVVLRIRGFIELKWYFGALGGGPSGGTDAGLVFIFNDANHIIPPDPSGINFYGMRISDPPQLYGLNNHPGSNITGAFLEDYYMTVTMRTGATVTLYTRTVDGIQYANPAQLLIPGPPPPWPLQNPPNGQGLQMLVSSIA